MMHATGLAIGLGVLVSTMFIAHGEASETADALRLVGKHKAVWSAPPSRTPADHSVDGPLMGNGDMKVAIGGPSEEQQLFLAKNDLWRLTSQSGQSCPVGFGHLAVRIPALKGASYKLEQTWSSPETVGTFTQDDVTVRMRSMVAATRNLLLLELVAEGKAVEAEALLRVASGRGSVSKAERRGNVIVGLRKFVGDVDIPSGVAVAWKVMGAETMAATGGSVVTKTDSYPVNVGREQYGGGRWGFKGAVDQLVVVGRALDEKQVGELADGAKVQEAAHHWPMDEWSSGHAAIQAIPGKVGNAWLFTGTSDCFLDAGNLALPVEPVTVACWIRIDEASEDANYILSCGEWNKGISLGLSSGKLRFAAAGQYVESGVLPRNDWVHVAGTWDGSRLTAYVNGRAAGHAKSATPAAGLRFTLAPGRPVTLVLAMDSVFKSKTYAERVTEDLSDLSDSADLTALRKAHAAWWADYWSQSCVEMGDPVIEAAYYRSLYHMGACSRDPRFPPGIFGWVTTDHPHWAGDYHLNYNHMAPFYALYSANRIEQADPEDAPILDFRARGRWYADNVTKTRGVLFPVGIGPLGVETTRGNRYGGNANSEEGGLFFQQRSNSAYCLVNIAQRWRTTYDPEYGEKVYPLVREVAGFWEDYLKFENDRYVIIGDAVHEGSGQDMNPILTLGLLRNSFDLALDMSDELKVDADCREKWSHILDHLSSWTTQEMNGKTVFRYTEKGTHWWGSNTLGIQHIYPGNALGLDSDPKWLAIAHNTIAVMGRWLDFNGSNSFFPAAVRVGYDPKVILERLRAYVHNKYANGFMKDNPHGIENYSTTPNTINEMLCMSHVSVGTNRGEQLLRVFPVWPRERDARFFNIRAWGAFLVSSELKQREVQYVEITSERGRDCTMVNPWPGRPVTLNAEGRNDVLRGDRFTFKTTPGEVVVLKPEGECP